jgi:RNA polymerase-associated protein RTF1
MKWPNFILGDDDDRARLEDMTEREREEELFKRAEIRENLRKRFEIQKKLKQQQRLKDKDGEKKEKKKVDF